jgi:hypothetical protein
MQHLQTQVNKDITPGAEKQDALRCHLRSEPSFFNRIFALIHVLRNVHTTAWGGASYLQQHEV